MKSPVRNHDSAVGLRSIIRWARRLALLFVVGWSLFPILFIFASALKEPAEIFSYPPRLFGTFTLKNMTDLGRDWPDFYLGLRNSLIITLSTILATLAMAFPAAYAFSRFRNRQAHLTGFLLIAARMFPPIIITIPLYPVFQAFGLIDSHITLILLYAAFFVSIGSWILKNYLDNVPVEMEESAFIEGCGRLRAFFLIILPLSTPGIVTVSMLTGMFCWKEFLFAFLFTTHNAVTAPVILNEMLGSMFGVSWGPLFAATTVQLLPILILVWVFQNALITGIAHSSDK
jgi:multiple sugar transport system permease protein